MTEDNRTQLKDINERIQDLIVESLKTSEVLYIQGNLIPAFKAIKIVFYKILPFDFRNRDYLVEITKAIDEHIEGTEGGVGKMDMYAQLVINQEKHNLKQLIEEYFKLIPEALRELNLYLRVIKRNDDYDAVFSEESFGNKKGLLEHRKRELRTVESVDVFIKNMTPKQVNDVHARLLTYKDCLGMKRIPYDEPEEEDD